jgi:hypothetical protein
MQISLKHRLWVIHPLSLRLTPANGSEEAGPVGQGAFVVRTRHPLRAHTCFLIHLR